MDTPTVHASDEVIREYAKKTAAKKVPIVHVHLSEASSGDKDLATVRFDISGEPVMRSKFTGKYPTRVVS